MKLERDDIKEICQDLDSVCISESLSNLNHNIHEICVKLKRLSTMEMSELVDRLSVTFRGSLPRTSTVSDKDCETLAEVLHKLNMDSSDVMSDCVGSLEDLTLEETPTSNHLVNADMATVCRLLFYLMSNPVPVSQTIESFMQKLTLF